MKRETVSVVIPCFNDKKYVSFAVESAILQSQPPLEIVLVDDGSTDDSLAVLSSTFGKDSRVRLISKKNGGLSSARNRGIMESRGHFVAFLDSDDIWRKDKLERQIAVFRNAALKNLGLVYCNYRLMDEDGGSLPFSGFRFDPGVRGIINKKLLQGNFITGSGSAVIARRECFQKVGLFDESLKSCEDWDMWLRISKQYQVDFVEDALVAIRKHQGNMQLDRLCMHVSTISFLSKLADEGEIDKNTRKYWISHYFMDIAKAAFRRSYRKRNALREIRRAASPQLRHIFRREIPLLLFDILVWFLGKTLARLKAMLCRRAGSSLAQI